jgi:hypothetical protein
MCFRMWHVINCLDDLKMWRVLPMARDHCCSAALLVLVLLLRLISAPVQ